MVVHAHLTFNGNCRKAMVFYQKCFGGRLRFQAVGQSPLSAKLSKRMKDCIVQAVLINHRLVLTGSDMAPDCGLIKGNAVTLSLSCASEKELKTVFARLSTGGSTIGPLQLNVAGALGGGLTDRFGNHWLLTWNKTLKSTGSDEERD